MKKTLRQPVLRRLAVTGALIGLTLGVAPQQVAAASAPRDPVVITDIAYAPPDRMAWWVVQSVVLGLTLLLALPVRRRRGGPR